MAVNQFSLEKVSKNTIATASFDNKIRLYDVNKLLLTQTLIGHDKGVWTCSYKPNDPNVLVSGSNDKNIILWDLKSGKIKDKLVKHKESV